MAKYSVKVDPAAEVFSTGQVAVIAGVAPRTVASWFDRGLMTGYRIPPTKGAAGRGKGSDRRIPRADLIRFLREHGLPLGPLASSPRTVLLVGVGAQLADQLARDPGRSCPIEMAADPFEAGLRVEELRPAVVVVDLAIGRDAGIAMARTLTRRDGESRPRLVALAGEDELDRAELVAAGFAVVLQRPFAVGVLAEAIR